MSYDFPDGPDYNPEPLDDDPWVTYTWMTVCSECGRPTDECISDRDGHYWKEAPYKATEDDLSDEEA